MNPDGQVAARPLRVAMVCPYSLSRPGGVQGQAVGLSRTLVQRGHQVTLFAPVDDPGDRPSDIETVATGRSVSLPANGSLAPVSLSPRAARSALRRVQEGRFDVAHLHEPFTPGVSYALLTARRVPVLAGTFHRSGSSPLYRAFRPLVTRLADRLAVRCAVSEAARETASAALGGRYEVLFNGIDVERYRAARPWRTRAPTVLFLGRHEERKGLHVLLEAFAGEPARRGAVLWIAGDGPRTGSLRQATPPSDQVEWLGVLSEDEKVRRLAGADVLCAPSLGGESFGMVLLEAMAARTAVVASDIPGYRDALGGCGWLVPPGDPDALGAALAGALSGSGPREEDHHRRLEEGSARAEQWSMARLAARYEEVYREAMAAGVGGVHGRA